MLRLAQRSEKPTPRSPAKLMWYLLPGGRPPMKTLALIHSSRCMRAFSRSIFNTGGGSTISPPPPSSERRPWPGEPHRGIDVAVDGGSALVCSWGAPLGPVQDRVAGAEAWACPWAAAEVPVCLSAVVAPLWAGSPLALALADMTGQTATACNMGPASVDPSRASGSQQWPFSVVGSSWAEPT